MKQTKCVSLFMSRQSIMLLSHKYNFLTLIISNELLLLYIFIDLIFCYGYGYGYVYEALNVHSRRWIKYFLSLFRDYEFFGSRVSDLF